MRCAPVVMNHGHRLDSQVLREGGRTVTRQGGASAGRVASPAGLYMIETCPSLQPLRCAAARRSDRGVAPGVQPRAGLVGRFDLQGAGRQGGRGPGPRRRPRTDPRDPRPAAVAAADGRHRCCSSGFAAFLVRHYFRTDFSQPIDVFLFGFHAAATVVLGHRGGHALPPLPACRCGGCGCRSGPPSACRPSSFSPCNTSSRLASCSKGVLDFPEGLWLVLIYTYALFIPNTRRRAAVAIGAMCRHADGAAAGHDVVVSASGRSARRRTRSRG